jgi:DNA-binding winged helix-turn-helix (wHTH) protein
MHWKFGGFEFNENNKTLTNRNQTLLLEPKTAAVLGYFCRHPQQDISRDMLLEFVWHGQIVTDGAINRVILKLRKALLDEDKIKSYITTVPKVGYRFIAQVSQVTNTPVSAVNENVLVNKSVEQKKQTSSPFKSLNLRWSLILLLVIFLMGIFHYQTSDGEVFVAKPLISPITRLAEKQFDASLTHNTKLLAYSTYADDDVAIFVVDPIKQNPYRISMPDGDAFNAHWSTDDKEIIYLFYRKNLCQFHRVAFIAGVAQSPEVLYQCSGNSFTKFVYEQAEQKLYFVERETFFAPYYAYELDLEQGSKRRLSQPVALGKGNHLLQRDEQTGKVLLLSDQKPGKTTAYQLNIGNNTFEPLLAFDYSITSAVWNHQTDGLVHPAQHPSYSLLNSYFDQRTTQTLVVDSNRISEVSAINNGKDYLFTSYMNNRDIEINNNIDLSHNSSVMDYLPELNRDGSHIAFISKRTGYSKVWLINLADNSLRSIEPPDKGRTFYSLQWSFDNRYLLANTDSGIIVFDSQLLTVLTMISPDLPTYAVGWLASDEIGYSLYKDKRWQLHQQNINSNKIKQHDQRWAFALGSPKSKLLIDQQMALYLNGSLVSEELHCRNPIARSALTLQFDGQNIYCVSAKNNKTLLKYREQFGIQTVTTRLTKINRFSVSDGKLATTKLASSHSDIIRTNF